MEMAQVSVVFFSFLLCTYLSLLLTNWFITGLVARFRIVSRWMFLVSFIIFTFGWNLGFMHNL
ncbi:hypothetical protein B0H17DRAFT_1098520 [Mycena rosella]|uniref:Uncharacterized protein n=1 Tax=Mycena rosella TaxID=1033263 RepID=A0AAD7CRP4_MYCRO|nr:hypothetical protein B0H17DRAFT_1098520 [Mycena rosella]